MVDGFDFFSVYVLGSIEMLTAFCFFTRFLQRKVTLIYNILFALIGIVVMVNFPAGSVLEFTVCVLLFITAGIFTGKKDWVFIVLYAVMIPEIMYLCYGIVNSLSCLLFLLFSENSVITGFLFMTGGNVFALALSIVCYQVVYKYFMYDEMVGGKYTLLILMPALLVFLVSEYISSHIYGDTVTIENGRINCVNPYPVLLIQVLGVASLFCILYAYKKMLESFRLSREVSLLEMETHFLSQYVEEAKIRYEKTKSFRHDVKNHAAVVKELIQNGNPEAALHYMGDMEHLTAEFSFPVSTNNPVLDILIGNKLGIAKSSQIEVQCSFIAPYPCEIADIDFCIIFSNALDNAISACSRIGQNEPKFINISGRIQGDFLLIEIQNSDKGTGDIHRGTGLNNIKAVAEKYHGTMEVSTEEKRFILSVLLIIPQRPECISQQIR